MREVSDDLRGRVCVVTGATSGIGLEIARGLALLRARVVLACRDEARASAARDELESDTCNNQIEVGLVDLSSQASIRAFAEGLGKKHEQVHVLVNNAGVMLPERRESVDGVELTWATNVLGYFLLTELLIDQLKASKPARVVNVASTMARGLDLDDVEMKRRRYDGMAAYAQSKQADRMITWRLAEQLEGTGVVANAMHPGVVSTGLMREAHGLKGAATQAFVRAFGRTPVQGADTAVWLAASYESERSSGNFYVDRKIVKCPFRDEASLEKLWGLCSSMTRAR